MYLRYPISLLFVLWLFPATSPAQIDLVQPTHRREIADLLDQAAVKKAFDYLEAEDEQTVADNILLNEIPAPPFGEEARAAKFLEMLQATGIDSAWIDREGNVVGLRRGREGARTVALDAHLDTVFPEGTEVDVTVKGDTLFAPGVGDDTRGLAMVLAVLRAMNEADIRTRDDVLFIGTVGEEGVGDLRGVKHLFSEEGPGIDAWISIDGGDLGRINHMGLGSYRYRALFKGPGGHSWGAFGLANPHHALGAAIRHFTEAADRFTSYGARTTYNVGRIGGGTSVNSIPFTSWMEVDLRSVSPAHLDALDTLFRAAMQRGLDEQNGLRREGRPLNLEIELIGRRPSGELAPTLPLIQRAMAALAPFDLQPRLTRGSTNANIPISQGIPAITIGRGGSGAWNHSLLEWWANEDGHLAVQYALLVLLAESGVE